MKFISNIFSAKLRACIALTSAVVTLSSVTLSCSNDFDNPGLISPEAPVKANTSILDLKKQYWNNADNYIDTIGVTDSGEHTIISGRVISSDEAGNIYKNLVIQDETAALTISINANSLYTRYRIGQKVVIDLTGLYIGKYSSLQQLGYPDYSTSYGWQATFLPFEMFEEASWVDGLPDAAAIDTLTVTIPQLDKTADILMAMQSQLVRINNVEFVGGGQESFCSAYKVNTNRTLKDTSGNELIVRTSGYSRFWSDKLPAEPCDVVGILSYNGSGTKANWQLLLRDTNDILNIGNPTLPVGTRTNPYKVAQVVDIEKRGKSGMGWVKGYITGAVKAGVTEVRSADDIQWEAPFDLNNTLIIGEEASSRSLEASLLIRLPQGSDFRKVGNLRDNPSNLHKEIMVYGSFHSDMGTYAITDNKGTTSEFNITGVEVPGGAIADGDGTKSSPLSPSQVRALNPSSTSEAARSSVWVAGYIVGWVNTDILTYAAEESCMFTVPATKATNLLLASTPDVKDFNECISLNLPTGSIRSALNLQNNPANLGKKLLIEGDVMKYVGMPGVKNPTDYEIEGGSTTPDPVNPDNPVTYLSQDFNSIDKIGNLTGWILRTPDGNKPWFIQSYNSNSFAACTGYNGTPSGSGFDSWLITPALNVDGMKEKVASFTSCVGYSGEGRLSVYVMTTPDPATATLTQLNPSIPSPSGSWSEFVASGQLSLAQFSGVVYIGFRYTAKASDNYTTYRIDDVLIGASAGETPDNPDLPDVPGGGDGTAKSPYNVAAAINAFNAGGTYSNVYVTGYIVGSVDGMSIQTGAHFSTEAASGTNILIADAPDVTDVAKCIPVQLPSGAVRSALNLSTNPGNLSKQVTLKGNIEKYFGVAGLKSASAYNWGATGE